VGCRTCRWPDVHRHRQLIGWIILEFDTLKGWQLIPVVCGQVVCSRIRQHVKRL
jgi:hypothetical protein